MKDESPHQRPAEDKYNTEKIVEEGTNKYQLNHMTIYRNENCNSHEYLYLILLWICLCVYEITWFSPFSYPLAM